MDNKGINGRGLAHLWSKITSVFATKKEVQESSKGLNGLTFVVSDTVPTVDDRSIITFVVED